MCTTLSSRALLVQYLGSGDNIRQTPGNFHIAIVPVVTCCTTEDKLMLAEGYVMLWWSNPFWLQQIRHKEDLILATTPYKVGEGSQ